MSQETLNIRPLADRIVVEPQATETKTSGGIYIPDTADKDKPMQGTVRAVGEGRHADGKITPLQLKVGEKVLFGKYAGTSIKIDNKDLLVMREDDVLAVVA